MPSLRELMKLEKRRRAESITTPINSQITQSTTDDDISDHNSQFSDVNSKLKRVTFSEEPLITQIEEEESQLYVEPKVIHEEYFIEDFQTSSPLYTDTTNVDDDDSSITSPLYSSNKNIDNLSQNFNSESAILAKIKQDKEKWLKIAGLDSFEYTENDNHTSLITNTIVNTKPKDIDINDVIKMKIDETIGKSNATISSSNFESASTSEIKASVANLPVGFFDDKDLDSQARGQATREEAIEQLKNLAKLEKIITSQDLQTPDRKIEEDLELNKLENNDLLKSLIKQKEQFNPIVNDVVEYNKDVPIVPMDDNFELDWRARNL